MDCKEAGDMTLSRFFRENPRAALGFSGGVDSAYLLYAALTAGAQVKAYYVKSPFQPRFELEDARRLAEELGADWEVLDGTNASDDDGDRPGIRALRELSVRSPLRECGLTKGRIRELSREAKLFTWDKPAYACLATRIPTGTALTLPLLERTERGEDALTALGFRNFRVRYLDGRAKIQVTEEQMALALEKRQEILAALRSDYTEVLLDLEVRHA